MAIANQVIIIGGGLSGLSAAHTVLERGGNVLLLEKLAFCGGNSTKATSGMNGALTTTQMKHGVQDSPMTFYDDTAKSARDLIQPELVKVLTYQSASAVEWVQESFGVDLSLLGRLGGHSQPRTHRGQEKFPGMTITTGLLNKFEKILASSPDRARLITKAHAKQLIVEDGKVVGVEYEKDGRMFAEFGPVVIATGGYACDFTDTSLIKKYRPELFDLPSSNLTSTTGDGHKMAISAGANIIHPEKIQVHPTGLIDPKDPDNKWKALAAEALRGAGGLLLNCNGDRFIDELQHRDVVTAAMWEQPKKGPIRLVMSSKAAAALPWHVKHYSGRGLMRHFKSGAEVAKEIGVSPEHLKATFDKYNAGAAAKNDPFGKRFFDGTPFTMDDEFHVAMMTPVLHYTMGGINIDDKSRILAAGSKEPIPGLFAAGEAAGGVHGANRLGGSSLLGCVVFGRVSGGSAAEYLFHSMSDSARSGAGGLGKRASGVSSGGNGKVTVTVTIGDGETTVSTGGASSVAPAAAVAAPDAAVAAPAAAPAASGDKSYSMEDVAKHNTKDDCWVVVNGQVLDVTKFLDDHPGGAQAILLFAGRDATEEFNMLHEADVVQKYAPEVVIGKFAGGAVTTGAGSKL